MCSNHSTFSRPAAEEPFRYARSESVRHLHEHLQPDHRHQSGRAFAATAGVPHSTLRYWEQRQQGNEAPPDLVAFFESPAGLAFLKQLLLALHVVFQQLGIAGIRPLGRFLELAGLAPFVASSYGTHQRLAVWVQQALDSYDQEQRQHLAARMKPKTITLCEDENFHGPQPCLVAIEPISNFLVLEVYQPQRDAATWNRVVQTALQGLPVTVVQVTSDLAQGLQSHARDGLGANHSPDLLHVQADIHKGTSLALHRHLASAQEKYQETQTVAQTWSERYRLHQAGIRSPGQPPDFEHKIAGANQALRYWEQQISQRQERQEQLTEAVRGLGDDYHPYDSHTGQALSAEQLQQRLEQRFATIEHLAAEAEVSDAGREKIAKAKRVLPRLVATLVWFWHSMRLLVESLELREDQERVASKRLLPGLYWSGAAERGRTAADKHRLRGLAEGWLASAWSATSVLSSLPAEQQALVKKVCQEGVNRFVRSSSCVEGRNGQLSLHHHGSHALSPGKLKALTVLHNYFIERADGTTAAERFFGQKPADLFTWMLERFPDPPRPANGSKNRSKRLSDAEKAV
jgi:hypothetical protein